MTGIVGFWWRWYYGLRQLGNTPPSKVKRAGPKAEKGRIKPSKTFRQKVRHTPAELRLIYLEQAIYTEVTGAPLPNTPKMIRRALENEIGAAGSVTTWARGQEGYEELKRETQSRPRRKRSVVQAAGTSEAGR
jgi:hypothetical protein